ncbi:MAG: hypothetical protein PVJ57_17375 [Phycisphaerae bacterium]|jgi:hypothetical protein
MNGFKAGGGWLAAAVILFCCAAQVIAQDAPVVTGVSSPTGITWTPAGGEAFSPDCGVRLDRGQLIVAAEQQAMLYSAGGQVAIVAIGPCTLDVRNEDGQRELLLREGRLALASTMAGAEQVLAFAAAGAGTVRAVEGYPARGWTYLACDGDTVDVAYIAETQPAETLPVTVGGDTVEVADGQRLIVSGGMARTEPLDNWLAEQGFRQAWPERIGVASARDRRQSLQKDLFLNVIKWDRYSQAQQVITRLRVEQFRPEIRVVQVAVTGQLASTGQYGTTTRPPPFSGANEVPPLSPAAVSVGGVTAVQLNVNARELLTATGSRGLGFNGLSRLAIPGLLPGGLLSTGPAGLGAQR